MSHTKINADLFFVSDTFEWIEYSISLSVHPFNLQRKNFSFILLLSTAYLHHERWAMWRTKKCEFQFLWIFVIFFFPLQKKVEMFLGSWKIVFRCWNRNNVKIEFYFCIHSRVINEFHSIKWNMENIECFIFQRNVYTNTVTVSHYDVNDCMRQIGRCWRCCHCIQKFNVDLNVNDFD